MLTNTTLTNDEMTTFCTNFVSESNCEKLQVRFPGWFRISGGNSPRPRLHAWNKQGRIGVGCRNIATSVEVFRADDAVAICLSVCLSGTIRCCVETAQYIIEILSPHSRPIILVSIKAQGLQRQNCLARTVVKAPKSSHITPILRSLHWLKINERIEYKLLSLTYKVLTTSQPDYLHNLISVQSTGRTRSSSLVTLARPSVSSSLQVTNRSFTYASPYLWNQLPSSFRQPHSVWLTSSCAYHLITVTTLFSSPITAFTFHSSLKTHLFHKSFHP